MIYLDHAATTPVAPEVLAAMLPWLTDDYGNPASDHALGRKAAKAVATARAQVAALLGATPEEILFTSGATEANNLAIKGALEYRGEAGAHVVTSRTEHKCVLDTCRYLETRGVRVTYLTPDADGRVTADAVLAALTDRTVLVSLMWVNNELGTVNDVERLAPLLRERGVLLHVDAVQAAGKLAIDLGAVPIDLLSVSAHKLYGPKGTGALFVRKRPRARLAPQLHGGGHEQGMRSGTLATHQIAGMGAAFALASGRREADVERLGALRDRLLARLSALPRVLTNGAMSMSAAHILNLSFEGVEGESLRALLPTLAVSSGSACSSATAEPSYVLRALGRSDALANASLRFSPGRGTTEADVDAAAAMVIDAVLLLREIAGEPAPTAPEPEAGGTFVGDEHGVGVANVFGYSEAVWQRFRQAAAHVGSFAPSTPDVLTVTASDRASASSLRLQLLLESDQVKAVRFHAFGCPVGIAAGAWLAETLPGKTLAEARALDGATLRRALEIPEDKLHCALMAEDALRQLPEPLAA